MLDTDLEGLDPQQATEYVLAFITTLKQTEKALAAAEEESNLWTRRVDARALQRATRRSPPRRRRGCRTPWRSRPRWRRSLPT